MLAGRLGQIGAFEAQRHWSMSCFLDGLKPHMNSAEYIKALSERTSTRSRKTHEAQK